MDKEAVGSISGIIEDAAIRYAGGHATDFAQVAAEVMERVGQPAAQAAVRTLEQKGYTYHGGELWKPPIGKPPRFITEEPAAQAAGLTDEVTREQIKVWASRAGIVGSGANGALTESNLVRLGDFAIAAREALLSRAAPSGEPVAWQDASASQPLAGEAVLVAAEFGHKGDWRIKVGGIDPHSGDWHVIGASWRPSHWAPLPKPPVAQRAEQPAEEACGMDVDDMRVTFEKHHCGGNTQTTRRNEHGDYVLLSVQDAWAGWQSCFALLAAPAAGAEQEPVGIVGTMPGTTGFTMAVFEAEKVPVGTSLYTAPQAATAPAAGTGQEGHVTDWNAWISDANRDEYIEALLDSLSRAADRETERYMVRTFMGGWPMWLHVHPKHDTEPVPMPPESASAKPHPNCPRPESCDAVKRCYGGCQQAATGVQGLTREDILRIGKEHFRYGVLTEDAAVDFARAVLAASKEGERA